MLQMNNTSHLELSSRRQVSSTFNEDESMTDLFYSPTVYFIPIILFVKATHHGIEKAAHPRVEEAAHPGIEKAIHPGIEKGSCSPWD
jgi:hypothetical protein